MSKKIEWQPSLCALLAGVMALAFSDTASAQSLDQLREADANGDGSVTWQEMMDMRVSIFGRLDRNGNGVVESSDSPSFGPGRSRFEQAFNGLRSADANRDGRITRSEMLNAPAPLFENGDTDRNRVLSASELAALRR
jgi:hypothetical protein